MKNSLNKLVILLLAVFAGVACTEHTEYNDTGFSAVEELLFPSDGDALELIEQADANTYFEWEVSKVGTPVYTVVFLDAQKKEVGRYLADNNGQKSSLKLLHSQLNTIAAEAGIAAGQTGDLYWTVCAGLGGAELLSPAAPHKLTVTCYDSMAIPYHLYVTGEGSEFGADPAAAQQLRELGNGQFEIYTMFDGAFNFVNRNGEGNKRVFGISEEGRLTEGADAVAEAEGFHYVQIDFKKGTVKTTKITDIALLRAGTKYDGVPMAPCNYKGNGVWMVENFTVPTNGDDRYRFRAVVDGEYQIWGSKEGTDAGDPGQITGGSYFDLYFHTNVDNLGNPNDYARIWKFHAPLKGLALNVLLDLSPTVERYTHSFDLGFDPEATAVTLSSPADQTEVELSGIAGSKVSFSWNKHSDTDPAGKLTTYALVLLDAADKELAAKDVQYNDSAEMTHSELESAAEAAGIATEATGDIYWAVRSKLLNSTALSDKRALTVTRMKGIPTTAYITGAASEFGAGFQALKSLGGGKFEIFTKLKAGTYNFTDGKTAESRKYTVSSDGKISEGAGSITVTGEDIYYILLDFAGGTATYKKIEDVRYISPNTKSKPDRQIVMPYQGNGIWYAAEAIPYMTDWEDDRYFFWVQVDGVKTKFGATPNMGGDLHDAPAERDPRYRVFWPIENVDGDDAGAYKALHRYRGNTTKRVNVTFNLCPNEEHYYTHNEYLD